MWPSYEVYTAYEAARPMTSEDVYMHMLFLMVVGFLLLVVVLKTTSKEKDKRK